MCENDLPKNCEIKLLEEVNELNLEKFKTKKHYKGIRGNNF